MLLNAFVSDPSSCASILTILSGRYNQNTGVYKGEPCSCKHWQENGENKTIATILKGKPQAC